MNVKAYDPPYLTDVSNHQIRRGEALKAVFPLQDLGNLTRVRFELLNKDGDRGVSIMVPLETKYDTAVVFPADSLDIITTSEVRLLAHPTNSEGGYGTVEHSELYLFLDK